MRRRSTGQRQYLNAQRRDLARRQQVCERHGRSRTDRIMTAHEDHDHTYTH
jgi:hypothetical protein